MNDANTETNTKTEPLLPENQPDENSPVIPAPETENKENKSQTEPQQNTSESKEKIIRSPKINVNIPESVQKDKEFEAQKNDPSNLVVANQTNRPISAPKVNIKIPETLLKDKDYEENKKKPDNAIIVEKVEVKEEDLEDNRVNPEVAKISIPSANSNQVSGNPPQSDSGVVHLENLKKALRTQSSNLKCPFCQTQMSTEVTKKCSIINILCAIFTTPILWACLKCCRGKDCNCYDAKHKCQKCRRQLADYSAC